MTTEHMSPAQAKKAMDKARGTQLESEVLTQCREYLRIVGWFVVRMQAGFGCHKGIADLYCVKDGRDVWLEIKTLKGKQSEHQVKFQADIEAHGGEYIVARSLEDGMAMDRGKEDTP